MTSLLPLVIIPMLLVAALSAFLAFYLGKRAALPTNWRGLPRILLVVAGWMLTGLLITITPTTPEKLLWGGLQQALLILLPSLWFLFVLAFSGEPVYRLRRWRRLLALEPGLMLIVLLTTAWHGLYWRSWSPLHLGGFSLLRAVDGPAAVAHAIYTTFLMTAATALLLRVYSESTATRRKQTQALLVAGLLPWAVSYSAGLSPAPEITAAISLPPALLLSGVIFALKINTLQALRVIPMARKTVIDKLQDGIIVLDKRGHIVDLNPAAAAILDHPVEALIGQPAGIAFSRSPHIHENYRADTLHRSQIEVTLPDGPHYYDLQITLLQDDADQFTGQLVTLHDITAHKRAAVALEAARQAAEAANRTKSEFLANMSHELRTPLNVIIGYTDLTLMGTYGALTETQQERLTQVSVNGKHLATLLNDLIDISRVEAHDFTLDMEVFDPAMLLRDALRQVNGAAQEKGLAIHPNIPDSLPQIRADARRLAQVLSHLLNNAIKFTTEGYLVVHAVILRREDAQEFPVQLPRNTRQWLMIAIQDTGIGIPPSHHTLVFEGFRQVDGSHTRRYQGSGLGLTIASRFTRLMNGHIWIESSLQQGSTIYVLLPVYDATRSAPAQPDSDEDSGDSEPAAPRIVRPQLN